MMSYFLVVVENIFNLPTDSELVKVGAMLWPIEENIQFSSEVVELTKKRCATLGHAFTYHLEPSVYKKVSHNKYLLC